MTTRDDAILEPPTAEERAVLRSAERDGYVSAKLYSQGDFSEEGFLLFGRLEAMCLKGLLRFVEPRGENERSPGDVRMVFAPRLGAPTLDASPA